MTGFGTIGATNCILLGGDFRDTRHCKASFTAEGRSTASVFIFLVGFLHVDLWMVIVEVEVLLMLPWEISGKT